MQYREQPLGTTAVFLLPSLKLRERRTQSGTVEDEVHGFLMQHFDGYTAAAGNIFGYWRDVNGAESYGEHRQFSVALVEENKLEDLKRFLGETASKLGEECIYLESAGRSVLIYPKAA